MEKSKAGIALIISSLIIIASALSMGLALTAVSTSQFSEHSKKESITISNAKVWMDQNKTSSRGYVVVHNDGDKEVKLDTLTVRGKQIPYTQWYYSKIENTYDDASGKLVLASRPVVLRPGESAAIYYVDSKPNITPSDAGIATTVTLLGTSVRTPIGSSAPYEPVISSESPNPDSSPTPRQPTQEPNPLQQPDTTAPTLTPPPDIITEATGTLTEVSLGTPIVSDLADPSPVVTNDAPAVFPVGTTVVTWTAKDSSNNIATATQLVTITLDGTAPQTTLDIGLPRTLANGETHVGSSAVFTLSATDQSGISSTQYQIVASGDQPSDSWVEGTSFTLSGSDGPYTIYYRSIDIIGNIEPTKSQSIVLDTALFESAPLTILSIGEPKSLLNGYTYVTKDTQFNLSTQSSLDIRGTFYRFYPAEGTDRPPFISGQSFMIQQQDGTYIVEYYSIDVMQNVEPLNTQTVILDSTAPSTSSITDGAVLSSTEEIILVASDNANGSGVGGDANSGIFYAIDSENYIPAQSSTVNISLSVLAEGQHALNFYSVDALGNAEQINRLNFFISETYSAWSDIKGVNIKDPMITGNENKPPGTLPSSKALARADQNLIRIKELGFNTVRAYYHWEAYVHHPTEFLNRAEDIARQADQLGLKIVWDNHQWYVSSYLRPDIGTGFPSYVLRNSYVAGGGDPEIQRFWDDLVNNRIYVNGVSVWDLQADFMIKLVNRVDRYDSTLGYEILNEPRVYTHTNFEKLGVYHTYMAQKLREQTTKTLFFDKAIVKFAEPIKQRFSSTGHPATIPQGVDNIVFAPHDYDVPCSGCKAEAEVNAIKAMADKLGIPVVYGEWAAGSKEDMAVFLNKFKEFNHGWIYHSYAQGAMYNLLDSNNQETVYLTYLLEAINEVYQ